MGKITLLGGLTNSVRLDSCNASLALSVAGNFGKHQYTLTNPRVMQFALRDELAGRHTSPAQPTGASRRYPFAFRQGLMRRS
jgi:hypothetical protein